jgi:hypothetical protein
MSASHSGEVAAEHHPKTLSIDVRTRVVRPDYLGTPLDGFTVGYCRAAGAFWAGAVICGALIRGGTRLHHEAGQPEPLDEIVSGLI